MCSYYKYVDLTLIVVNCYSYRFFHRSPFAWRYRTFESMTHTACRDVLLCRRYHENVILSPQKTLDRGKIYIYSCDVIRC